MATTITKTPDGMKRYIWPNGWDSGWSVYEDSRTVKILPQCAFRVAVPGASPLTACTLTISIDIDYSEPRPAILSCGICVSDPSTGGAAIQTKTVTLETPGTFANVFSFSGLNISQDYIYFLLKVNEPPNPEEEYIANPDIYVHYPPSATLTINPPALTVGVTPSSLYTGDYITADFSNRLGQQPTVSAYYNTTLLYQTTAYRDSLNILCQDEWFTTAGVSGNSMTVKVRATDGLGRTSNDASFTLQRPTAGTINLTAPRSTTLDGTASINFAWSYSGDGYLTGTDLQWSRDNAVWTDLTTISGSGTTWTAPAVSFPGGTIYWRGRVTNSFGLTSAWSSSVSFTVNYSAVSQTIPVNSPTSGIISAAKAQTFQIALEASAPVYEPFTVAAAKFYWRAGESGAYTALTMTPSNNTASVTIPGGTFPSGTIQWYAEATDNTGRTTATAVYTLTAQVSDVEATPLAPINVVVSGDSPIVFRWAYGSIDGTPQGSAKIQTRTGDTDWTDFATIQGTATSYTAPAGSLPGGKIYWRVRSYNTAAISRPGAWSSAVSFNVFSAPQVIAVSGDGKPFLTISWQVSGQLAYKIEVDGKLYGPYRGADVRTFTLAEPLADGLHTVRVAAQNEYTLWSPWFEANISVENVPGPGFAIDDAQPQDESILVVYTDAEAAPRIRKTLPETVTLDDGNYTYVAVAIYDPSNQYQWYKRSSEDQPWTEIAGATSLLYTVYANWSNNGQYRVKVYNDVGEVYSNISTFRYDMLATPYISGIYDTDLRSETGYFLIFRDGVLIGRTPSDWFSDRAALGAHEYYVVQVLPGGYYTKSNSVTLTAATSCPMIALLSGGDPLRLELSENADRTQTITRTGEVAYVQYSGATYPEAEIGEAESLTAAGDVSFTAAQEAEARRFEAMLKKPVIYKIPGGDVIVGVLQGFSRKDPRFFKSYTFSVTQMNWRDYVEP